MRYRHELIDRGELLKEIDTSCDTHNNSVLWVRNLICKAEVKEPKIDNICNVEDVIYKDNDEEYTIGKCTHCQ